MRVAVDGDAIRPQRHHLIQRAAETVQRLQRQAVDQVDTDRAEACRTGRVDHLAGLLEALDAVDRLLHRRIKILNADRHPVEAQLAQGPHIVTVRKARVDLDAVLAIRLVAEAEVAGERLHQLAHACGVEKVGGAATKVELAHRPVTVEQRRDQLDLAVQPLKVAVGLIHVAGDHPIAAAVEARTHAERHVHVQRQRTRNRLFVGRSNRPAQCRLVEIGGELRRRRIAGVARSGHIVAGDQRGIEFGNGDRTDHGESLSM